MPKAPTEIKSLARAYTDSALNVLRGIMQQETAPAAARVAAAQALLDRGWGKPTQSVEVSGEVINHVIRAPAISSTMTEWQKEHVPKEHISH